MEEYQNLHSRIFKSLEHEFDAYQQKLRQCLQDASNEKQYLLQVITNLRDDASLAADEQAKLHAELVSLKIPTSDSNLNSGTTREAPQVSEPLLADLTESSLFKSIKLAESDGIDGTCENETDGERKPQRHAENLEDRFHVQECLRIQTNQYECLKEEHKRLKRSYELMRRHATAYKRAYQRVKDKLVRLQPSIEYNNACKQNWDRIFGSSSSLKTPIDSSSPSSNPISSITTAQGTNLRPEDMNSPKILSSVTALMSPKNVPEDLHKSSPKLSPSIVAENDITINVYSKLVKNSTDRVLEPQSPIPWSVSTDELSRELPPVMEEMIDLHPINPRLSGTAVAMSTQSTDPSFSPEIKDCELHRDAIPISDDVPVIISERKLKRRRLNGSTNRNGSNDESTAMMQDGSPERPYTIKQEVYSSPLIYNECLSTVPTESLDLDEVVGAVDAPRSGRHFCSLLPYDGNSTFLNLPSLGEGLSTNDVFVRPPMTSSDAFDTDTQYEKNSSRKPNTQLVIENAEPRLARVPYTSQNSITKEKRLMAGKRPPRSEASPRVLQPLSVNQRLLTQSEIVKIQGSAIGHRAALIDILAEDGEDTSGKQGTAKIQTGVSTCSTKLADDLRQRIGALLERHPPAPQALNGPTRLPRQLTGDTTSKRTPSINKPKRFNHDCAYVNLAQHKMSSTFKDSLVLSASELDQPLRSRPLKCLTLTDFKIDPKRNQGVDFAFTEVVRGLDNRHCLPNCSRPDCCGDKFHKMIEIGGALDFRRGLWDSSQDDDDDRLLKEFLGDDYINVNRMSKEEKDIALNRARTQRLASSHGKHKMAHQRASTPPGFWRTDFPSTQELKQDKAAAEQMERSQVKQRYEDAMRPDGLWRFRDE